MFLRQLKNELVRGMKGKTFYAGLLVCCTVYVISFSKLDWINMIKYPQCSVVYWHNQFLLEFNPCRTLLSLPAVLAYCGSLAEDWEHRNVYFQSTRCSFLSFCFCKFITAGILGGMTLMAGLGAFLNLLHVFLPLYQDIFEAEEFIQPLLQKNSWFLYLLYYGSLQFLFGFFCAGIGCIAAVITNRRGIIYLCPMLLFAMLEIISGMTLTGLSGGQSSMIFRMQSQTPGSVYGRISTVYLLLTAGTYVIFFLLLKRRVYRWQ